MVVLVVVFVLRWSLEDPGVYTKYQCTCDHFHGGLSGFRGRQVQHLADFEMQIARQAQDLTCANFVAARPC